MQVISLTTTPVYDEPSCFSIILRKLTDNANLAKYFGPKVESAKFFVISPYSNIYFYDLSITSLPMNGVSFDILSEYVNIDTFLSDIQQAKTVDDMVWWVVYKTLSAQAELGHTAPAQVYKWTVSKKGVSYVCA